MNSSDFFEFFKQIIEMEWVDELVKDENFILIKELY